MEGTDEKNSQEIKNETVDNQHTFNNKEKDDERKKSIEVSNQNEKPQENQITIDQKDSIEDKIRSSSVSSKNEHYFKVSNPLTKDGIKSYTLYTVDCSLIKNTVYKRYSDFDALRSKLVERWPGVYIPNIPHKKIVGNLESSFIEMRCRQLSNFTNKLAKLPYLFYSEEVKFFLNSEDVEKSLNKLPKESYDEVLMKYKRIFLNVIDESKSSNIDEDINLCSNFMNKVLVKTLTTIKVSKV